MFLVLRAAFWTAHRRRLPNLDRVVLGFAVMKDFDGRHIFDHRRKLNPDRIHFIIINADLMNKVAECKANLLHEMAHLAVSERAAKEPSHGPSWEKEVARLRALGADVAD